MTEDLKKQSKKGPEGPAIWIDPEPPADYTYKPVDTSALLAFLQPVKAAPVVSAPSKPSTTSKKG